MIDGNFKWKQGLAGERKRPLYIYEIPSLGLIITSFLPQGALCAADLGPSGQFQGGWGVFLEGVGLWGN